MGKMNCRICNTVAEPAFISKVLDKYDVKYFKCNNCGFLFAEEPYWLKEAYEQAINLSDTGLMSRNLYFSQIVSVLVYFNFRKDAKFLDYAGGYGVFTRLMRDIGFDFYWHDPYTQNLLANGFEHFSDDKASFELLTAFEVFEHLLDPITEIKKMLELTDSIILSTTILPEEIPDPNNWWYYGFEHGQHISFYSNKTFQVIAEQLQLNYYQVDNLHLLTRKKLNKSKLVILKKMRNFGLLQFVKKIMRSKTEADHKKLRDKEKVNLV